MVVAGDTGIEPDPQPAGTRKGCTQDRGLTLGPLGRRTLREGGWSLTGALTGDLAGQSTWRGPWKGMQA